MNKKLYPERITNTHAYFWNSVYSQWHTKKIFFKKMVFGILMLKNI